MTTYLVTRHEGTRIWASAMAEHGRLPFTIDRMVDHLDPESLKKGDVVVGTLPIHVAAELRARGIEFWSLDLHLPPADRGKELSGLYLAKFGARFTRYEVRQKDSTEVAAKAPPKQKKVLPGITVIAVSGELAPAAIGWLHRPTPHVCLLASPAMKDKALTLRQWLLARTNAPKVAVVEWDDRDYATLLAQADELAADLALDDRPEVVINLTGGTKPMAMALQRAFGKRSESFGSRLHGAYVDTTHRRIEEMLAPTALAAPMNAVLSIGDHMALHGLKVNGAVSANPQYGRWLQRDSLLNLLKSKRASAWLPAWYTLLDAVDALYNERRNPGGKRSHSNNFVTVAWDGSHDRPSFTITIDKPKAQNWKGLRAALLGEFGAQIEKHGVAKVKITADNVLVLSLDCSELNELSFLSGGWMECWLASIVAKSDADDFAQSITVLKQGVKNEFDLLVAAGNRLLLIEVKTAQLNREGQVDSKATEAVYKLDAVAERVGRYFSERWLVSLKDLNPADLNRARTHQIRVFSGDACMAVVDALRTWIAANSLPRGGEFKIQTLPSAK